MTHCLYHLQPKRIYEARMRGVRLAVKRVKLNRCL